MKLGIVGQGFVGSAIYKGLKCFYETFTYDLDSEKCNNTHQEVCRMSDIIFVCVPTPMKKSGECDTTILEQVVTKINDEARNDPNKNRPIIVIKSTVPPGTTKKLNKLATICDVCFCPEFLTEANSFEDFKNQSRIIIGGDPSIRCQSARVVKSMFRKPFPRIPIVVTKYETAEMIKYFTNCFLATKVTFANQMYEICEKAGVDYDKVCEYALYDERIGRTHLAVPGPDGDKGFGGHCFPKDLSGIIHFFDEMDGDTSFLEAVREKNDSVRKDRNWEKMIGRAVVEDV